MPPNVLPWDNSSKPCRRFRYRQRDHEDDDDDDADIEICVASKIEQTLRPSSGRNKAEEDTECLWQEWLARRGTLTPGIIETDDLVPDALASIVVMDNDVDKADWLFRFHGQLSTISIDLLEALRNRAPQQFQARVADFNDNLLYQMQNQRGFDHLDLDPDCEDGLIELEKFLQANEYLGSFLSTESSCPQPPHVDYTWEILKDHEEDQSLMLGFFPLTHDGMFLQVWPTATDDADPSTTVHGQVVWIPYGKILMLPASTIHGGGFRTTRLDDGSAHGNLRFHLYVATDGGRGIACLPVHQSNKYTEKLDKTTELSRRYVDSPHMATLMKHLFVTGKE